MRSNMKKKKMTGEPNGRFLLIQRPGVIFSNPVTKRCLTLSIRAERSSGCIQTGWYIPDLIEIELNVINPQFSCLDLKELRRITEHRISVFCLTILSS